jgi:hypothetical protein
VRCGRCGALFHLHYSGKQGEWPEYRCSADQSQFGGTDCQRVRALALDSQVEERFLEATLARSPGARDFRPWRNESRRSKRKASSGNSGWSAHGIRPSEPSESHRQSSQKIGWSLVSFRNSGKSNCGLWKRQRKSTIPGKLVALARSRKQTERPLWLWAAIFLHVFQASTTTNTERKQMVRLVIREVIVASQAG